MKKLSFRHLVIYISTLAVFAAAFIGISLYLDPGFILHYSGYGNEFEVFDPIASKAAEVIYFYRKLYYMVSGTYYTPDIRLQFILFPVLASASAFFCFIDRKSFRNSASSLPIILSILALNAGMIIIGRYNQTSIVFQFPLFYLLAANLLGRLKKFYINAFSGLLLVLILTSTVFNILPHLSNDYEGYLKEISGTAGKGTDVLANLNSEFCFENGRLHDFRNLAYLKENNMSIGDYIKKNDIGYVIYPEELELIHEKSPKWDAVYGSLTYFDEMKAFLENSCVPVHEFTSSTYGMRISEYINTKDWRIVIYRVKDQ